MTRLKHLTSAMVLTFALTGAVLGGTIDTPAPPPPPSGSSSGVAAEDPGIIHMPGAPSDSVTDMTLNILQTLLSVF
jgi:hypothetical protein